MDKIENLFYDKISKQNFNVYGILDGNDKIHTLGTDSKIIGRIFEMITQHIRGNSTRVRNEIANTSIANHIS